MSRLKPRWIAILSLAAIFLLSLVLALGFMPSARIGAEALTYAPSAIFSAGTDGDVAASTAQEGETSYVEFTFRSGGKVYYRRDLALKWFEADEDAVSTRANPAQARYFGMTLRFPAFTNALKKLTISFESAEENISKDGKATNALVFEYNEGAFSVVLHNAAYDEKENPTPEVAAYSIPAASSTVPLGLFISEEKPAEGGATEACEIGEFALYLTVGAAEADEGTDAAEAAEPVYLGCLTNIGGYFMEYRSSAATTPQTPMTFEATFAEDADSTYEQKLQVLELNGQELAVGDDGRVEDTAVPALVLSEGVYSFRLGQRFSLTYEAIDVLDDSVNVNRSYYMLKTGEDGKYIKPSETSSKDYSSLTTSTFFMPPDDKGEEKGYVSIRFRLEDGTHSDYYVYLTWYAANDDVVATLGNDDYTAQYVCSKCGQAYTEEEYTAAQGQEDWTCPHVTGHNNDTDTDTLCGAKLEDLKLQDSNAFDYLVVDLEAKDPAYLGRAADEDAKTNTVSESAEAAAAAYQEELDKAAENVSAGDGAYLYLPSLRGLIASDSADYRNLRFSVYYYKPGTASGGSASSATSLRYNNLRIEVDEVGEYRMRILAVDAAGNAMKYYDADGELVDLSSSNIWDIEEIPEFTFTVDYEGPSIEDAGRQTQGFRDRTYNISSFKIIALTGYKTDYELYRFDESKLGGREMPTYDAIIEMLSGSEGELEQWMLDCLVKIDPYNDKVTEDDEEWERTDNAYHWDPDSGLTFCPQERAIYFVKVNVTDSYLVGVSQSSYMAIEVVNSIDTVPRRSRWLQDNLFAIICFSVAAVLAVAVVVLFVVNPSDKTVEEVDLDTLKGKKNGKEKKDE